MKSRFLIRLGLGASAAVAVVGMALSFGKPVLGEFAFFPWWAEQIHRFSAVPNPDPIRFPWWGAWNPPLYFHVLGGLMAWLGNSSFVVTSLGWAGFLTSAGLVYCMGKHLFQEAFTAAVATGLFLISPLMIQGSLVWSVETTILPPIILGWCYYEITHEGNRKAVFGQFVRGGFLALIGWAKFTALPVAMLGYLAVPAINRWQRFSPFPRVYCWSDTVRVLAIGLMLFLLTWGGYAWIAGMNFWGPFIWFGRSFTYMQPVSFASRVRFFGENLGLLSAWISPFALALIAVGAWHWRHHPMIWAMALAIFLSGFVLGGNTAGLPRYQYPAWGLLALIMVEGGSFGGKISKVYWVAGIGTMMLVTGWAGDLNDHIYHEMLRAKVDDLPLPPLLWDHALKYVFLLAGWAGLVIWNRDIMAATWMCLVAFNLATNVLHARAPYITHINYGIRGTDEMLEAVRGRKIPMSRILAGDDLLMRIDPNFQYVPGSRSLWDRPEDFLRRLGEFQCVVVAVGPYSYLAWKQVLKDPEVVQALADQFERREFGSYVVWFRVQPHGRS